MNFRNNPLKVIIFYLAQYFYLYKKAWFALVPSYYLNFENNQIIGLNTAQHVELSKIFQICRKQKN